jgi:hypothetical protein
MSFFERYFAALDGPDPHSSLDLVADEVALGETRRDSGERIGTFLAVAQLDDAGRMTRYMVARTPAIAFESARVDAG